MNWSEFKPILLINLMMPLYGYIPQLLAQDSVSIHCHFIIQHKDSRLSGGPVGTAEGFGVDMEPCLVVGKYWVGRAQSSLLN